MQESIYQDFSLRGIWHLIWPQMVIMYSVVATGICAVWTAGHISSDTQAALGMVNQCNIFLMVVIMALSSGATAAVSQSLGAGKRKRALHYIAVTVAGSLILGLILTVLGRGHGASVLSVLQVPKEIIPLGEKMWDLMLYALPAQHVYAATGVIFRSTREVMQPLSIAIVINIVIVLLCLGLGLGFFGLPNLGYAGLLYATIVSQTLGALLHCFLLYRSGFLVVSIRHADPRWLTQGLPYLVKVAVPAGFASLVWQTGYLFLFILVASLPTEGLTGLAGLTAGLRIESLLFLPAMAVNTSLAVLIGNCLGAGRENKARSLAVRIPLVTTIALSGFALLVWPMRDLLAEQFSCDPATQTQIVSYLTYNLLSTPFSIASTVMGGVMVGAGATAYNLAVYGGCSWLIRLPLGYILGHTLGYNAQGIFCAMLVSQIVQAILMILVIRYAGWTEHPLRKKTAHSSR